jgi:hypothetical protein
MSNTIDDGIVRLIERLKDDLLVARQYRLDNTTRLLEMAILDVQTVVHAITDDELRSLSEMIDRRRDTDGKVLPLRERRTRAAKMAVGRRK